MTDPKTVQAYNDFAEEYSNHTAEQDQSPYHAFYEKPAMRAEVPNLKGKKALSLGCGSGEDTVWLNQQGAEAHGIDIAEGLITIAEERYPECQFQVMDMENLNFPDNEFDFAYSSLAIHYIKDWKQTLSETHRVLKQDALYVFSTGHPIDSSMQRIYEDQSKEAKLGVHRNLADGDFEIFGDYLVLDSEGRKIINAELLEGMKVQLFHRPISKMIEDITASGFSIVKMIEPTPTEDMKNIGSPRHYETLRKIPLFIIWVLQKK